MADYFTHFSCLLDVGCPDKAAREFALFEELRATDQDADDQEVAGFDLVRQDAPEDSTLWLHDDEHGDVEAVIGFVLRLAGELDLTGLWGFQYALCRIRHKAYYAGIRIMPHGQCPRFRALALAMRSFGIFRATRGRPAADRLVGIGWI
ncbi:hypothetical protein [Tabrizicola fusiformis]|uniref:hypothetical protein n=1 Tax=Tabrizicola sp. SY72 TaxID=2741673 RepID=UPI001F510B83|nr:hypothetical protein [Tabrizicola sp. SY72]